MGGQGTREPERHTRQPARTRTRQPRPAPPERAARGTGPSRCPLSPLTQPAAGQGSAVPSSAGRLRQEEPPPYPAQNCLVQVRVQVIGRGGFPDHPLVHHVPFGRVIKVEHCPLRPVEPQRQLDDASHRPRQLAQRAGQHIRAVLRVGSTSHATSVAQRASASPEPTGCSTALEDSQRVRHIALGLVRQPAARVVPWQPRPVADLANGMIGPWWFLALVVAGFAAAVVSAAGLGLALRGLRPEAAPGTARALLTDSRGP